MKRITALLAVCALTACAASVQADIIHVKTPRGTVDCAQNRFGLSCDWNHPHP